MNIINYQSVSRKSCGKCGGTLIKNGLGFWACSRRGEPGRMQSVILVLITLVGLFASSAGVQAQSQSNRSYLPIFRQDPPPATFDLRVMRVSAGNGAQAGCVNPLAPVAAMQGAICPLPGDYISLVANNPSSIALGGRQGDGSDAAWAGEVSEFSLIEPTQVIVDADIVEIDVSGYVESAGLFTAPGSDYSVIVMRYPATAAAAQSEPIPPEQADFHQTLDKMLDEGQIFDVDWPDGQVFWDRFGQVPFSPSRCGVTHAVWLPNYFRVELLRDRWPWWFLVEGTFEPAGLDACMGQNRWVKVADLMTHPAAENLRNRVNTRRGGNVTPFQWVTDTQGTVYAFWSLATGTLAYYGYRVLNSTVPNPAMFLYIPNEFLDVTCTVVDNIKTCLIQEGEPGQ